MLLLFGGFCLLVSLYYTLDVVFDDEAGEVKSPANPNSPADPQEGTPLLPNKLAEEDQIRLRFVLPLHLLRSSRVFFTGIVLDTILFPGIDELAGI